MIVASNTLASSRSATVGSKSSTESDAPVAGDPMSGWSRTADSTYLTLTCEQSSQTERASPAVIVVMVKLCEQLPKLRLRFNLSSQQESIVRGARRTLPGLIRPRPLGQHMHESVLHK